MGASRTAGVRLCLERCLTEPEIQRRAIELKVEMVDHITAKQRVRFSNGNDFLNFEPNGLNRDNGSVGGDGGVNAIVAFNKQLAGDGQG